MAKPSWLNDRIADEPIVRGEDRQTDPTENPSREVATAPAVAPIDQPNSPPEPAAGQFPPAEFWGTRDEWKEKTEQIIDPETGIWTGRTRQIFLRTSECSQNMSIEDFVADLDWISSLVK